MDIILYLLQLINTNINKSAAFKFYLQIYSPQAVGFR